MDFVEQGVHNKRRKASVRAGVLAVSAAVAGFGFAPTVRADITNGFAGFAAPNITQAGAGSGATITNISTSSPGGIGISADKGTFEATDGRGYLASSVFNPTAQNITSFDATFTYQASSGADGGAFVIQNSSLGVGALGADGGSAGYDINGATDPAAAGIANSAAFQMEIFNGNQIYYDTNGVKGSSTAFSGTNNPTLGSNDPIQVTLEYYNNTLTANMVDLTNGKAYAKIYANANIQSAVGGGTALVGFTGGTGGTTTTQKFSNFTFVSGQSATGTRTYVPIPISGFNQAGIITVAKGTAAITGSGTGGATMDNGTNITAGGDTWYEQGWNTFNTSTGIPKSGTTFTSQYDSAHQFTMPSYLGKDVFMLTGSTNGSNTATITFSNPTPLAYSALSFLTASGNGPSSFKATIHYSDTSTPSSALSVISPDWFNNAPSAWYAGGRDTPTSSPTASPDQYAQSNGPDLYESDLVLPDSVDPISSITLNWAAGGQIMIFAVSGVVANNAPLITYTGAAVAGKFDNSTLNFNQSSSGTYTPVAFATGDQVIFDDTAVDTAHNITVATVSGGILSGGLIFNNTTATAPYTFTGAGIGGPGTIAVNGGGTVILDNPNTFSGAAFVNAGALVIGTGGNLASNSISVSSGATLNVSGGTLSASSTTGISLTNSGTVDYAPTTLTLSSLSGSGPLAFTNSSNTALTITGGGVYSGSITQTGTLSLTVNSTNASTGAVILSGSNTYSGTTTLKAGALEIGTNSIGSGPINLSGGSLGAYAPSVNLTNTLVGGALIVPSGTNVLELSNSGNTFTGPIVLQGTPGSNVGGGTLVVDNPGSLGATTSITVASGATFKDNSGDPIGAGTTLTLSGTGAYITNPVPLPSGPSGALTGGASQTNTFAGNINISGPAYVAPGSDSILNLTGAITGTGTLVLTAQANQSYGSILVIQPPSSTANTYVGETQILPGPGTPPSGQTIQIGTDNALSPNSGLNIVSGTSQTLTLDLNGHNQSVTYLTGGGGTGYSISNSQGTLSTFTISNGNNSSSVPQASTTSITGMIAIVKNGPGVQTLAGNNTYTGGTIVNAGTLAIPTTSGLGTGSVTLAGGKLSLSAGSSFSGLFNSTTQGNATVSGGVATLTTNGGQAGAAFTGAPVSISSSTGFSASFLYSEACVYASNVQYSGFSFVLSKTASSGGGTFNNQAASPSLAVDFNLQYDNNDFGGGTYTGIATNGGGVSTAHPYALDTYDGETSNILVTINYSNGVLTEILQDQSASPSTFAVPVGDANYNLSGTANPITETFSYNVGDISQILGGANGQASAYIGFTGISGFGGTSQNVSNVSFSGGGSVPVDLTPNNNAVIAAPNTSSILEVGTSPGSNTELIPSLTLNNGSTVALTTATGSTARVVLSTPSLNIANSSGTYQGQLDIKGNDLDLPGASLATITGMVKQGYANGTWTGNGVASTAAATDPSHLTALGVIVNDNGNGQPLYGSGGTISTTFDGSSAPAHGDILVKYTYYGDANLDGSVNSADYALIDGAYLNNLNSSVPALTGWFNGDFNYDGVVNGSDYTLIDNAFNMQGSALSTSEIASPTAAIAGGSSAVPEPTSLGVLALGSVAMLGRRRRNQRMN